MNLMISKSLTIAHISALKMKFPSKKYIVNMNCTDLLTFPKEIFKGKLYFLQTSVLINIQTFWFHPSLSNTSLSLHIIFNNKDFKRFMNLMISKSLTIAHISALKMKFPSKQYIVNMNCTDLLTFPKEIFKSKLYFLQNFDQYR